MTKEVRMTLDYMLTKQMNYARENNQPEIAGLALKGLEANTAQEKQICLSLCKELRKD